MLYLSPALMTFPAFANSKLFLWAVFVRLTVLCARKELANETWRGRQSSESVSEMLEWQDSSMKDISVMPFPSTDVTEASVLYWKMAAAMKNIRYFSRFFISGDKYRQIWCKPILFYNSLVIASWYLREKGRRIYLLFFQEQMWCYFKETYPVRNRSRG